MEKQSLKVLSASRIKTLETCSWVYWNNYHTKVPQSQNDGALRGTICHTVFELLLNKRHLKNYKRIIKKNAIDGDEGVNRLVKKLSVKVKLDESNYKLLNDMILVGLKNDFFGEGGEIVKPEYDFEIKNDEPKYQMVDTSFLVATLTAAIQEQQAIIEDLKTRIEILENK
jgi:hypothetical protein